MEKTPITIPRTSDNPPVSFTINFDKNQPHSTNPISTDQTQNISDLENTVIPNTIVPTFTPDSASTPVSLGFPSTSSSDMLRTPTKTDRNNPNQTELNKTFTGHLETESILNLGDTPRTGNVNF